MIVDPPLIVGGLGRLSTDTVAVAVFSQPLSSVPVTVYTIGWFEYCGVKGSPFTTPPVQEYDTGSLQPLQAPFKIMLSPSQIDRAEVVVTFGLG